MICCENSKINKEGICTNCDSLVETLIFENEIEFNYKTSSKTRYNKFRDFIYEKPISNFCRITLLDMFPTIETEFGNSDRTNFINLNQMVREILPLCGYEEYMYLFPPLKTKSRCNQIKKLISRCWSFEGVGGKRLEDLEYLEPKVDFVDMSKVVGDHVFSDRSNIDAKRYETETQGKTSNCSKAKAKAKVKKV